MAPPSRGSSFKLVAIAVTLIFLVILIHLSLERALRDSAQKTDTAADEPTKVSSGVHNRISRLSRYCNINHPEREKSKVDINGDWVLKYVAINIRHGDRSAIHRVPGTKSSSRLEKAKYLDQRALLYAPLLSSYNLTAIPSKTEMDHDVAQVCF